MESTHHNGVFAIDYRLKMFELSKIESSKGTRNYYHEIFALHDFQPICWKKLIRHKDWNFSGLLERHMTAKWSITSRFLSTPGQNS